MFKVLSRIRFSLRTLLIVVLLIGALMTVKWRWEPWAKLATIDFNASWPNKAGFVPDGSVYTAENSGRIELFSATGKRQKSLNVSVNDALLEVNSKKRRPTRHVQDISFTPDCTRLIVSLGGRICLVDSDTGRELATLGEDEREPIFSNLSHDGKTVVVAKGFNSQNERCRIKLFESKTGKSLQQCTIEGIWCAWFTPDDTVNAVDTGGYLWQWDWRKNKAPILIEKFESNELNYFSNDNRWCTSANNNRRPDVALCLTVSDATSGAKLKSLTDMDEYNPLTAFAGSVLIAATTTGEISRYDLVKKTNQPLVKLPAVHSIALHPDGQEYAAAEVGRVVVSGMSAADSVTLPDSADLWTPQYSPDGNTLMLLSSHHLTLYQRRRPNYAWSVYAMPELWLSALLAIALLVSIYRDYRPRPPAAVLTLAP